jgi:hypothetical protein
MNERPGDTSAPIGSNATGTNGRGAPTSIHDPRELRTPSNVADLGETLRRQEERIRVFAAAHPVPVLMGAFALGYLLARLVRRGES